jgi:hypothetical protein
MKWLSVIFSVITLYFLMSSLFIQENTMSEAKALAAVSTFTQPHKNMIKLAIEADWLIDHEKIAAQKKAMDSNTKAKAQETAKKPAKLYPTLSIAGVDYQLLGIFKSDDLPFILIKANKLPIMKVVQGTEVSPGIVLQRVQANKITLNNSGNTIEFKLFEPITHV